MVRKLWVSAIGVAILLGALELIGRLRLAGATWPPLSDVVAYGLGGQGRLILGRAMAATLGEALGGLLIGTVIGLLAATFGLLLPWLRAGMSQAAIVLSTVPLIALGPILITTVGSERTPAVIAALGAGFTMFVAMSSAFSRPADNTGDLFRVLGASRLKTLVRLTVPASVPAFFDGLALAAPSALLGAVVGEWFGAARGIGVLLVSSMQNFAVAQLWAAALCTSIVSLAMYGILTAARQAAVRRFT